jgi:molybdopterin-guanine dinucleotide biosynthesis protein A
MTVPVYALVLAGGKSSRMQTDKAALAYHGRAQLDDAMHLVAPLVARAFVSVRPDQVNDPLRAAFAQIVDRRADVGPIAGIMAAQEAYPDVAWLVLACDLPFLSAATVKHLLRARDPARLATAYRSSSDGLPEPLCAIYEPASRAPLVTYLNSGRQCPRKFLGESTAHLIALPDAHALDNINTRTEYEAALRHLQSVPAADARRIRVQYYALLREEAGRSEETLATGAATPRELFDELKARHPFSLPPALLRVAVNDEFADWTQPLADGDRVVFIPPVAGG